MEAQQNIPSQYPEEENPQEVQPVKVRKAPHMPTKEEVEEHEAQGHAVHRSWCAHCVQSRAVDRPHEKGSSKEVPENAVPRMVLDCCHVGEVEKYDGNGKHVHKENEYPIIAVKDTSNKFHWSMTLPRKGANCTTLLAEMVRETGHKEIQLGSDNEPAILALKGEVVKALPDLKLTPVEAQTGDHRSNDEAEVAVKEIKWQCRAILSTLEDKMRM